MGPAFAQPPVPRKKAGSKQLLIIGLVVAIGTPCLGMVGCMAFVGRNVVRQARNAATQARSGLPPSTIPYSTPTPPSFTPYSDAVDAATQAANDAYIEEYVKLLEDFANVASQIRDLASAETHGPRVRELADQINRRQVEAQFKLIGLPLSERQRTNQKYGARLEAAQERARQADDRLLQLSSQLQIEALRSGIDSITPPAPSLPPTPTPPSGPP
jgi:hypothetical protein